MAVDWKQIMIMLLKGVSQSRVAGAVHCSKRDVARAARVVREHGVTMETLAGMDAGSVRDRWFPSKPREADSSYAQPDMDSYVERKGLYRKLPVKFLWYDYRNKAGETGAAIVLVPVVLPFVRGTVRAIGRHGAPGAPSRGEGVHRLVR